MYCISVKNFNSQRRLQNSKEVGIDVGNNHQTIFFDVTYFTSGHNLDLNMKIVLPKQLTSLHYIHNTQISKLLESVHDV